MRQNCGKGPREYQGTSAAFSVWFTEAFSRQGCQDPTQSFLSASCLVSYLLICEPTKFEGQENLHQCGLSHLIQDSIIHASTVQFSSVQSLSRVRLFVTPWITARQASLSITNSRSSLKVSSIESVMPSSHLILCRPLFLLPPIPPSIRVFSNEWKMLYTSIANNQYRCYPLTKDILSNRIWLVTVSSRQF